MRDTILDKIFGPVTGIAAPFLGVVTSMQNNVAWVLQIISLLIGIAVGAISLYRKLKR